MHLSPSCNRMVPNKIGSIDFRIRFLFAYRNIVYDLTPFVDEHPGGRFSLQTFRGKDLENV